LPEGRQPGVAGLPLRGWIDICARYCEAVERRAMRTLIGVMLLGLVLQACSMTRGKDLEAALFAELFDVPRGSCKELRAELDAEIEAIKVAKKKADQDFLAEQQAPPQAKKPPRRLFRKEDPLAALREWTKKSQHAEKLNAALKEGRCRTVDIEAALK
jgi:hypothetical protein